MNKQLTPMQELRSYLDLKITKMINANVEINNKLIQLLEEVDNECIRLLPKEKQVIIEARENGFYSSENWKGDSQDYYNNKFKND